MKKLFGALIIFVFLILSSCSMKKQIIEEKEKLISESKKNDKIVSVENISSLPIPVQNWLKYSGIINKKTINLVCIEQNARIKLKPEQKKWYSAKSKQLAVTQSPAYIWSVNLKMNPFMTVTGRDKFSDGNCNMLMKLYSLFTIVNESGRKIDEGAAQRFLAEIVWYPSLALSEFISWQNIDENSVKATLDYKGTKGSCEFFFKENGEIEKITALRYYGNDSEKRYEWIIDIIEYSNIEDLNIPTKMDVTWNLDSGKWKWLEMEVTDFSYE